MCSPLKLVDDVVLLDETAAGPLHGNYGIRYPVRMKPLDLAIISTSTTGRIQIARVPHTLAP